jgi:hypothetical protein
VRSIFTAERELKLEIIFLIYVVDGTRVRVHQQVDVLAAIVHRWQLKKMLVGVCWPS